MHILLYLSAIYNINCVLFYNNKQYFKMTTNKSVLCDISLQLVSNGEIEFAAGCTSVNHPRNLHTSDNESEDELLSGLSVMQTLNNRSNSIVHENSVTVFSPTANSPTAKMLGSAIYETKAASQESQLNKVESSALEVKKNYNFQKDSVANQSCFNDLLDDVLDCLSQSSLDDSDCPPAETFSKLAADSQIFQSLDDLSFGGSFRNIYSFHPLSEIFADNQVESNASQEAISNTLSDNKMIIENQTKNSNNISQTTLLATQTGTNKENENITEQPRLSQSYNIKEAIEIGFKRRGGMLEPIAISKKKIKLDLTYALSKQTEIDLFHNIPIVNLDALPLKVLKKVPFSENNAECQAANKILPQSVFKYSIPRDLNWNLTKSPTRHFN